MQESHTGRGKRFRDRTDQKSRRGSDGQVRLDIALTVSPREYYIVVPHHGEETVDVGFLSANDAQLLGRRAGEAFLHTRRTSWTSAGQWVEQVDSLLDPEHFRLRFALGDGR